MKPGIRTTEWWSTFITQVVAVVAIVHPGFNLPGNGALETGLAAAGAAVATAVYGWGRAKVKAAVATPNPYVKP